ncbi:TerD family protein [Patescibacteria group bacterium]
MGVSLKKGQKVSLKKVAPGLTALIAGLGWDPRKTEGVKFDLDVSMFLVGADGKVPGGDTEYFVFYGNPTGPNGSVIHQGDNQDGSGEGDDEQVMVDLTTIPGNVEKIVIAVSIDEAEARGQNFGQVDNAYVRLVNPENDEEVLKYDLSEDACIETAMIFAELYKHNGDWKFNPVGQGYAGGFRALVEEYGIEVDD